MGGDGSFVIAAIETHQVRVSPKTLWSFVRVVDADGHVGWGEGTMPGVGTQPPVAPVVAALAAELVGTRMAAPIDLTPRLGRAPAGAELAHAAAISAVDQALWDIAARRAGRPIAALLGTIMREEVELYANINRRTLDRTPEGFVASVREPLARGYTAFKIAPFDGVTPANADSAQGQRLIEAALARAAAVRAAIGRSARLMIDCHWRLTEASAMAVLAAAKPLDPYWLECALPEIGANFAAMRRLRSRANDSGIRTAGCETMVGRAGFKPFLEAELYDVIMPDVKYAGGMVELLRIASIANAFGVATSAHNPTGPICHAHSLQLSTLIQSMPFLEHQYDESPIFLELIADKPSDLTAARVARLARPGLGLELDDLAVARHRVGAAA